MIRNAFFELFIICTLLITGMCQDILPADSSLLYSECSESDSRSHGSGVLVRQRLELGDREHIHLAAVPEDEAPAVDQRLIRSLLDLHIGIPAEFLFCLLFLER